MPLGLFQIMHISTYQQVKASPQTKNPRPSFVNVATRSLALQAKHQPSLGHWRLRGPAIEIAHQRVEQSVGQQIDRRTARLA